MFTTDSSVWTGVFSNTLQAQDWYVMNDIDNGFTDLMSISIGGISDLYIIVGNDPREVVTQF